MKRCPQCSADYFDNMIEFCLEDGTKLLDIGIDQTAHLDTERSTEALPDAEVETVAKFPPITDSPEIYAGEASSIQTHEAKITTGNSSKLKQSFADKWYKLLEYTPITVALAHNYWQWLYLSRQNYYQFFEYLFSANFLIWFALLITGIIFGIISLKYGKSKSFAITALIILAVNLILFMVPR